MNAFSMKKYLFFVLITFSFFAADAQQANPELQSLIKQSFNYFPRFRELEEGVKANEQRVGLAATGRNPVITGDASYTYVNPVARVSFPINGENKELQFQPNHNFNTTLSIAYPVIDFGKTKLNVEKAKEELLLSKQNIEFTKAQLASQVTSIYYSIIYLQKAITVQDSVIAVLEANRQQVETRYKNGDALQLDVITMQNNIDIEQNRKVDLQNSLDKQRNLLSYATGSDKLPAGRDFDFIQLAQNTDAALESARHNNYDYIIARERVKLAEAGTAIVRKGTAPSINLIGNTGFKNGFQPEIMQYRYNYAAGVGVSIPIYDGGRQRRQVKLAESETRQQELGIETLDNQYRKDIEQALSDIRSNQERLQHTEGQISAAREALRIAQSRFKNGISTNVELLNANTNLQKVELARIQYEYQLTTANAELARLMGVMYW